MSFDLAAASIDELNRMFCDECKCKLSDALNLDQDYTALCDSCADVITEMVFRMHAAQATKH
jgi:hypothetical protein